MAESQNQAQAQRNKPFDTKDRMGKPKAGLPISKSAKSKVDTNMVGGTVVKPVRTREGI